MTNVLDQLVNMALEALGSEYVVKNDAGQKIFTATPRYDDKYPVRVLYPPQVNGEPPQTMTVTLDEARHMASVLQNAVEFHEQRAGTPTEAL